MKRLNDIPKKNNFKVPDGYFENLDSKVEEKIKLEQSRAPKSAFQIFKPYIYMAASILALVTFMKFGLNILVDKQEVKPPVEDLTAQVTEYNEFIFEVSDDDIALYEYLYEDEGIEVDEEISDEEIEEYLSDYYLEYELLYE